MKKKTKKKKSLLKPIIIVVIIVGIVIAAMPLINNKVSSVVNETIKSQIALQGLGENVKYDSLTVDSINGRVTAKSLSLQDYYFKGEIKIDQAIVTVPVQDIMAFAISSQNGAITDVDLSLSGVKMDMNVEGVDVLLNLSTVEAQVNGQIDMEFINSISEGKIESAFSKVDKLNVNLGKTGLKSAGTSLNVDSLVAKIKQVENANKEIVSDFNIYMDNVKLDEATDGESNSIVTIKSYATEIQGPVVRELISSLAAGKVEIDPSSIDSMKVSLDNLNAQDSSKGGVNLQSLTAALDTAKDVNGVGVVDLQVSMTDADMDGIIDGDSILFKIGSYDTQLQGQTVLDFIDMMITGKSNMGNINLDLIKAVIFPVNNGDFDFESNLALGLLTANMIPATNSNNKKIVNFQIASANPQSNQKAVVSNLVNSYPQLQNLNIPNFFGMVEEQGESIKDKVNLELIKVNLKDGEFHINDKATNNKGSVSIGSLSSKMSTEEGENDETISDLNIAITDASIDAFFDDDAILFQTEGFNTQVQGKNIIDILDALVMGNVISNKVLLDSMSLDIDDAQFISPVFSMNVKSLMTNLEGVESVIEFMQYNADVDPKLFGQFKVNNFYFDIDDGLIDETLLGVEMIFGPIAFVRDPQNWRVDNLDLKLALENWNADLKDISLKSSWLDISGSTSIKLSKEFEILPPFSADIRVAKFPEELRPILGLMALLVFQTELPSTNAFTATINDGLIVWGEF